MMKDWKDISLSKFYKIQDILSVQDGYTVLNLLDEIYDIDSFNMAISDMAKYNNSLDFLGKEIPKVDLEEKYTINGTVYNSNFNLTKVTAAQFIDYQNYIANNKYEDYLSVFFIPEGHTYNDGYDMNKVKQDILSLPITVVNSLAFFFTIQYAAFYHHFLSYLKHQLKDMKISKEKKKAINNLIEKTESANSALFLQF